MDYLYVLVCDGLEWEDIVVYLTENEAIAASIKYKKHRVEIFQKTDNGYMPTYNYYNNGKYISFLN